MKKLISIAGLFALIASTSVNATLISGVACDAVTTNDATVNWMEATGVGSCLESGSGNIGQGGGNDDFLSMTYGTGTYADVYELYATDIMTFDGGSWSVSGYSGFELIGFKFGSKDADNWFVYTADALSGLYDFTVATNNNGGDGDRLSHITLYNEIGTSVPEPSVLALMAMGLLGLVAARRRS